MSSKKSATTAKEEAKPALVPKLRFPEFRGAEGWESKTLAEICRLITNGKANAQDHEEDGDYPLFDRSAVIKKSSAFMFDAEAVILPGEGMRFVPKYFRGKFNLHQRAYALMRHQGDGRFVYHSLDYFQEALAEKAVKSTVLSLRLPIVENFVIGCPKPSEQQKIAECLSSVDELMAAQARKVDALKTHKKGLMQQLFPSEGETQPRLRFPEFQNAGEWEERLLEGFVEEFRVKSTIQDEYEVLTSARSGLVRQRDYYDNDRITERDNIGFNVIPPNYMTYRSRSDDRQFYFNENNLGITGIVSVYYPVFRVINGSNKYLIELLSAFSRVVGKYSVGTSQTVLSLNQLGRIRLPFPPTVKEQQRIATCLSSLDALITAETQKLEALKTHKRGLMQQLFPSPERVAA